jgi:hypothetical protein
VFRVSFEWGGSTLVDVVAYRLFIREAYTKGWPRTRVPRGYVVTLPSGRLVALLRELR